MSGKGGISAGEHVVQPSLFDMFYEEFLTQFMSTADPTEASEEFMKLRTDLERTDFLMRIPFVRDFEIKNKAGTKSVEKAVKYREEGNKLFQGDKCTQAILFYNKSISYCPHPSYEQFQRGMETEQEKVKEVQFADDIKEDGTTDKEKAGGVKRTPSKFESLSLSYGNRSAALRKLSQFEDCLRDIARAAKFGYPKANIYKLWERKGKCYDGLKKYDLAAKCYRQALQCVKESQLGEREKASKTGEIQGLLKQLRNKISQEEDFQEEEEPATEEPAPTNTTDRPGRKTTQQQPQGSKKVSTTQNPVGTGPMQKASSQVSISHISTTGSIRPDIEVPELTFGPNQRLPSASVAVDLQFSPDKGRYFVAAQDLGPGDVILREEPYAAVLESVFRVNHCAHCLRKTPTPIPCYQCATVQYCTETCRDLSWVEYHKVECGVLSYLEPSRCLGRLPHLALRVVTKTGLQNLIKHSQQPQAAREGGNSPDPQLFDPTQYRSVHNLAANTDKRTFEDLLKKTAEATFMAKCLKFNGFFGNPEHPSAESHRAEIFVSGLLLRHLQIAATNGLEMAECILKNNDITKFDIIPVGGAIFPTMSFFNHSCYPNAMRLGYQNHQVVRVIRLIPKGEEVNIDYGFDFYATPQEYRQRRAGTNYHFKCDCVACRNRWPVYDRLVERPPQYRQKLTPELTLEIARQASNYQTAMELLVRLDINKSIPILAEHLTVMSELIVHPDARYLDCEEAYKQCLWLENRGFKVLKEKQIPKGLMGHGGAGGKQ